MRENHAEIVRLRQLPAAAVIPLDGNQRSVTVKLMKSPVLRSWQSLLISGFVCLSAHAQVGITQLTTAQLWQRLEFAVTNVPSATNPFDPNVISLDAKFS